MDAYEAERPAVTLKPIRAKIVGKQEFKDYKVGKKCKVQRDPTNVSQFVVYFENSRSKGCIYAKFPVNELPETIQYQDARGNL